MSVTEEGSHPKQKEKHREESKGKKIDANISEKSVGVSTLRTTITNVVLM